MSRRGKPLRLIEEQRFDCKSCARCCRSWSIIFSQADYERLAKVDWAKAFPELEGKELFVPAGTEGQWRFALRREDDACWFLDEQNRCKMHAHLGGEDKAIVCRSFPFSMADTPAGTFVSLRFNCPTVAEGGHGRTLEEQRGEIERLHRDYEKDTLAARRLAGLRIGDARSAVPQEDTVHFAPGYHLTWDDILRVEQTLDGALGRRDMSFAGRLVAAMHILAAPWTRVRLALLEQAAPAAAGQAVGVQVDPEAIFNAVVREESERRGRPPRRPRMMLRVVMRHLMRHVVSRPWSMAVLQAGFARRLAARIALFGRDIALLLGWGRVAPESFARPVSVRGIARAARRPLDPETAAGIDDVLERYCRAKLHGKFFFGRRFHGFSYVAGFNFLALTCSIARAVGVGHALAAGRDRPTVADVREGVIAVEDAFFSTEPFAGFHGRGLALALLDVEALGNLGWWWDASAGSPAASEAPK